MKHFMNTPISESFETFRAAATAFFASLTPMEFFIYVGMIGIPLYVVFWASAFFAACLERQPTGIVELIKVMGEVAKDWRHKR